MVVSFRMWSKEWSQRLRQWTLMMVSLILHHPHLHLHLHLSDSDSDSNQL
jgi:hypothetical protein